MISVAALSMRTSLIARFCFEGLSIYQSGI